MIFAKVNDLSFCSQGYARSEGQRLWCQIVDHRKVSIGWQYSNTVPISSGSGVPFRRAWRNTTGFQSGPQDKWRAFEDSASKTGLQD